MTETDRLRASRDGDQFHYHWGARQALKLLSPDTDLTAIVVEGVSPDDTEGHDGEDVIDIAEYYGAGSLADASRVVYRQLKHSTVQADKEWTVSGLSKTVKGFAEKFRRIRSELPEAEQKVSFEFLSNRPVSSSVLKAIEALASKSAAQEHKNEIKFLKQYAAFDDDPDGEALFFGRFEVDSSAPGLLRLEGLFRLDLAGFLPGAPDVEHVLLKEMVARRATSLESDPVITRLTVLTSLRTAPDLLLPAPNRIDRPDSVIVTAQTREIVDEAMALAGRPVIVHAAGGIGKSVFATQVERHLPNHSVTLVYDCFGNGGYRRASAPRHQHQQGLVQLSNELASHALCDPLIPSGPAQPADYAKAFLARVRAASESLSATAPQALLAVIVDAADNAALFAKDCDERTFVSDLLREPLPSNVRLLMLCRTERIDLLDPPPLAHRIELMGFGTEETKQFLVSVFGVVTDQQASEFHRLTGGNPRVQALALDSATDIEACLASLGGVLQTDGTLLDGLLQGLVDKCKDAHHSANEIDRLCEALAALRPRIPVRVLAELCSVPPALVHSFVADLGRPLLVDGDTLQFRDEPTETWFRTRCRPTGKALADFLDRLTPLAATEPYVAASLPQLLWEADQVDTLVDLALNDGALPRGNDLEEQEIAQQRAQFALKATLRAGRDYSAARLALKAAGLAAGHSRRLQLLRRNTDLAGQFLDARTIEDMVATRSLAGDWPGSNLHYEGALLSAAEGRTDFARSRLRSAADWIRAWVRQPRDDRQDHGVGTADIAEIAFGLLNTDGVKACIDHLARWRPKHLAFDTGLIIATRLADAGRIDELEELGRAATRVKYLRFAVAVAAWNANLVCRRPLAQRLVRVLRRQRRPISFHNRYGQENLGLQAVAWIVAMGLRHGVLPDSEAERILMLNLPKDLGRAAGSRYGHGMETLLCGYSLLARVRQQPFDLEEITSPDVIEARRQPQVHSRELMDHQQSVVPLAGLAGLWVDCLVGTAEDTDARFRELAVTRLKSYSDYETPHLLIRGASRFGARILTFGSSEESRQLLLNWYSEAERHISVTSLIDVVRTAAGITELAHITVSVAELAAKAVDASHESAENKAEQMVELARAVYRFDPSEAQAYFTHAIDLTDRVGDDVHAVWKSLVALTRAASSETEDDDVRAYRVAQVVEGLDPFVGDAADPSEALSAISRLSGRSATATASRWRDRRFCSELPFMRAVTAEDNSPLTATVQLGLLPFGGHSVNPLQLVERAFRHAPAHGQATAQAAGEFLRPERFRTESFDRLDQTANELGIKLDGTPLAPAARHFVIPTTAMNSSRDWYMEDEARVTHRQQAEEALTTCDLTTAEGWEAARVLVRDSKALLRWESVVDRAVRVPLPRLDNMVAAFESNPHFSIFDHAAMVKKLAEQPILPQAVRRRIGRLGRTAAARFCRELTTRSYDTLDLKVVAELARTPNEDLLGAALKELGSHQVPLSSEECYALAGRLAQRLPHPQAAVLLDDLTTMLADVAPTDSGDGEFARLPAIPSRIGECVAGYVWTALGDPAPGMRWQASHCVRLLAAFGCVEELDALHRFALGVLDVSPFRDTRLPFYDLHARQWLLFALARAAEEPGAFHQISLFAPLLKKVVFDDVPHVVMRESARTTLISLASSGAVQLTSDELLTCRSVNVPAEIIRHSWQDRAARRQKVLASEDAHAGTHEASALPSAEPVRFRFFLDFTDYWCRPLAEAFGMTEEQVERLADHLLIDRLKPHYCDEDPRHTLRLYPRDSSFAHKSEWPQEEDLHFYLSTHALWAAAGELVTKYPVLQDDDSPADRFSEWLGRFLISRKDGRWLSDRRDPAPRSIFTGPDHAPDREWVWRLNSQYFSQRLLANSGWITVWERSDDTTDRAAQNVSIRSALANSDNARALVLALQTAPSHWDFCLPDATDEEDQFSTDGFELSGWIVDQYTREGQDGRDPVAAAVGFPPAHPADEFVSMLGLVPDADMRIWVCSDRPALRSTVWSDGTQTGRRVGITQQGQRLEIQREALLALLAGTGRSLIVEVAIDRTHDDHKPSYSSMRDNDDDERLPFLERSFKIYLFDASGGCSEL
ncbi:hypothetical protein [Kitasatospora purpeofusca]|uniref:hypothetical protein n=1 Tax=Kitasatospora purpeofusca TaxID=67352 RepID=UPI00366118C0